MLSDHTQIAALLSSRFTPASLFGTYPAMRWWSPRQLGLGDGTSIDQVNDLSANANHFLASTTARPTYNIVSGVGRANFDANDTMALSGGASLSIGSVTKLTIIAAIRQTQSTNTGVVLEGGPPTTAGFGMYINNGANAKVGGGFGSTGNYNYRDVSGVLSIPTSYVATVQFDTSAAAASQVTIRIDGIDMPTVSAAALGTVSGNIQSGPARLGGRTSSVFFNSGMFDVIMCPGALDDASRNRIEEYFFNACGF